MAFLIERAATALVDFAVPLLAVERLNAQRRALLHAGGSGGGAGGASVGDDYSNVGLILVRITGGEQLERMQALDDWEANVKLFAPDNTYVDRYDRLFLAMNAMCVRARKGEISRDDVLVWVFLRLFLGLDEENVRAYNGSAVTAGKLVTDVYRSVGVPNDVFTIVFFDLTGKIDKAIGTADNSMIANVMNTCARELKLNRKTELRDDMSPKEMDTAVKNACECVLRSAFSDKGPPIGTEVHVIKDGVRSRLTACMFEHKLFGYEALVRTYADWLGQAVVAEDQVKTARTDTDRNEALKYFLRARRGLEKLLEDVQNSDIADVEELQEHGEYQLNEEKTGETKRILDLTEAQLLSELKSRNLMSDKVPGRRGRVPDRIPELKELKGKVSAGPPMRLDSDVPPATNPLGPPMRLDSDVAPATNPLGLALQERRAQGLRHVDLTSVENRPPPVNSVYDQKSPATFRVPNVATACPPGTALVMMHAIKHAEAIEQALRILGRTNDLRGVTVAYDLDQTLAMNRVGLGGLHSVRGGDETVQLLRWLKAMGADLVVVTARNASVSQATSTANDLLKMGILDIFGDIDKLADKSNYYLVPELREKRIDVVTCAGSNLYLGGYNKGEVVRYHADKTNSQAVVFLDDYTPNVLDVVQKAGAPGRAVVSVWLDPTRDHISQLGTAPNTSESSLHMHPEVAYPLLVGPICGASFDDVLGELRRRAKIMFPN